MDSDEDTFPGSRPIYRPYDVELEQALLGTLLVYKGAVPAALAELTADDFYDPFHYRLFAAIALRDADGRPITPLTLAKDLQADPAQRDIKVRAYLATMAEGAPSTPERDLVRFVTDISREIVDLKNRRRAEEGIANAQAELETGGPVDKALGYVTVVADDLAAKADKTAGSITIGDAAEKLLREAEFPEETSNVRMSTGLQNLDDVIGGLFGENLITVGGRPGMGKSILGTELSLAAARQGFAVDDFSLEMSRRENAARAIASMDYAYARAQRDAAVRPIKYTDLLHGKASAAQRERAAHWWGELMKLPIEVHDRDRQTIDQIAAVCRSRVPRLEGRKRLVVIDHLHLVEPSQRYAGNKVAEISEVTKSAKGLSKRLNCPVVLLSQLSRGVEARDDKRPMMADYRESGSIEQDSDVMIGCYRPAYYLARDVRHAKARHAKNADELENELFRLRHVLELLVHKNRNGRTDDVKVHVDEASSAIRDRDPIDDTDIAQGLLEGF